MSGLKPPTYKNRSSRAFARCAFGLVLFHGDDGCRCFFPGGESAVDVGDVGHAHVLQGFGGQGAAPACAAKQDELLALVSEHGFEVGRGRVHPELEHAPGREQSAGHGAFAFELTRVADVDDLHGGVGQARLHLGHAVRGDLGHGLVDEDLKTFGDRHVSLLVVTAKVPALFTPEVRAEQDQHRQQLQSAQQHGKAQNAQLEGVQAAVIARGAHLAQAGADVVDSGDDS